MLNLREWSLPIYTILIEMAGGMLLFLWAIRTLLARKFDYQKFDLAIKNILYIILITTIIALIGAHFHLSKPYHSFLALLNFDRSWLSREIAFSLLFLLFTTYLCWLFENNHLEIMFKGTVGWLAIFLAAANTFSMANIYLLPTQPAWNTYSTFLNFAGSALLLGSMALAALLVMDFRYSELNSHPKIDVQTGIIRFSLPWLSSIALILASTLIIDQVSQIQSMAESSDPISKASLHLLTKLYPSLLIMRVVTTLVGTIGMFSYVIYHRWKNLPINSLLVPSYTTCLLVIIGEILGRFLFYASHIRIGL